MMDRLRSLFPLALLALLPLVGACESEPAEEPIVEEAEAPQPAAAPAPEPISFELRPVGDTGVTGEVTAIHGPETVTVSVEVRGLPAAGGYPSHIHENTCAEGGGVAVGLDDVTATEAGVGSAVTEIAADALDPDRRYFVQVHGQDGAPIACGDIPGHGS